jgi:aminoglycoside 2''-phosphotransferase
MYQDLFNLSGLELDRIAEQIAIFLQQLHGVPVVEIEAAGIGASISCHSSDDWQKLYQAVEQELFPVMPTHIRHWVEYWFSPYHENPSWMENPRKVLVNGDLGPYHILYDDVRHTINGIIDFGTAGLGDPAVDFAVLLYNFGESFLKRIHHTYPLGEDVLDRARFWAGTVELQWALAGIRTRDCSWFLGHLGSARDIKPVGTPW